MDTKMILPLSDESPITYDLRLAIPLMAALSYEEIKQDVWKWIYIYYLQIVCKNKLDKNTPYNKFHIYDPYNPFIKRRFELHIAKKWSKHKNIIGYIINNIETGYYTHIKLDRFYMPGFTGFGETHIMHTECVYGYDLSSQDFYIIGFTNFSGSNLKRTRISFNNFLKAFNSFLAYNTYFTITRDKVLTDAHYTFDCELLRKQFMRYLYSKRSIAFFVRTNIKKQTVFAWDFPTHSCYGLETLRLLINYIESEYNSIKVNCPILIMLHALYEFMKLMSLRLNYLSDQKLLRRKISEEYMQHYTQYLIIRNLYIKYEITGNKELLYRINSKLRKCIDFEKEIIQLVVEELY